MTSKKVSDLNEGDGITATGPTAAGTHSEIAGRTYVPGDVVTVTGTVAFPDMNRLAPLADVGIVDAMDQRWVISLSRESVVEYHG